MKTITSLAWSNIKNSRLRSIMIAVSIVISTLLLTVIGVFGYGLITVNKQNAEEWYGGYYGVYKNVNDDHIVELERHSEFDKIGKMAILGMVEAEKKDLILSQLDQQAIAMNNLNQMLAEGHYPEQQNEIAAPEEFFAALGYQDVKIGDEVTVSYRMNLQTPFAPDSFIISGIIKLPERDFTVSSFSGYVSEAYYQKMVPARSRSYNVFFTLDQSVEMTSRTGQAVMEELAAKCGIDKSDVDDNSIYLMWKLDPGTDMIIACICVGLIVVFFSALVIYNIFQVGIVQKINEYGKVKALGATKKQMKQVVFREGMMLAATAVPLGMISGYIVTLFTFEAMLKIFDASKLVNSMNRVSLFCLPILILVAATAFATVWIALKKPMKIVARISPVEAMRYQESSKSKQGIRKGMTTLDVKGMTLANMAGNKRRTISTIISMGLSCVLFVVIANLLGNLDIEYAARDLVPHGQFQIVLDYSINDEAYPENNLDDILKSNPLNAGLVEKIKQIPQVTDIVLRHDLPVTLRQGNGTAEETKMAVTVLSREDFERKTEEGGSLGQLDYDRISKENAVVFGYSDSLLHYGFELGQQLKFQIFDGKQSLDFDTALTGAVGSGGAHFIITEDTFRNLGLSEDTLSYVWVDCTEKDWPVVEEELGKLVMGINYIELTTYRNVYAQFEAQLMILVKGGYLVCILIAVISFMNMANTIITSIITRKQEFGVLQAIGMTNRQLNHSLQMEGLFFSLGTIIVSMVIGAPAGYLLFSRLKETGFVGLYHYHFPIVPILTMVAVLLVMQLILSYMLSRNVKKESLVERIRYQG